jgi:hypothetical protein
MTKANASAGRSAGTVENAAAGRRTFRAIVHAIPVPVEFRGGLRCTRARGGGWTSALSRVPIVCVTGHDADIGMGDAGGFQFADGSASRSIVVVKARDCNGHSVCFSVKFSGPIGRVV